MSLSSSKQVEQVEWVLRLGISGMFLGHGVFALSIKQSWFPYFTGVGIAEAAIPMLLFLIGCMDIAVAALVAVKPLRMVLAWAVFWAFLTALIRPVSGDFFSLDFMDFVERSANFAAPLALLLLYGVPHAASGWLTVGRGSADLITASTRSGSRRAVQEGRHAKGKR
jgi:hypothetical protein